MFAPELNATELKLISAPDVPTEPVARTLPPESHSAKVDAVPVAAAVTVAATKLAVQVSVLLGNEPAVVSDPNAVAEKVNVASKVPENATSGSLPPDA